MPSWTQRDPRVARAAPWLLILATAAAPLAFRYLPLTDFPQHVAVAAILQHAHDPAWGFEPYYRIDLMRAPYILPYGIALLLGQLMPLDAAMRCVVALAIALQLTAVLLLLDAMEKPRELLLLAVPFAFHRGFFWGFVHFDLGIGLALLAIALLVRPGRSRATNAAIVALVCALAMTHVHGLLLFAGFALVLRVVGGRDALRGARGATALSLAAAALWFLSGAGHAGDGRSFSPPLWFRLRTFPDNVLGGWADLSELTLLVVFVAAVVIAGYRCLPVTRSRWRLASPVERALWIAVVGNVALYLAVPQSTPTAKFVHIRHAIIAGVLAPALACWGPRTRLATVAARALVWVVGVGALLNAWDHLWLFDVEARSFDRVVAAIPERPRLASLTFDKRGRVAAIPAYLHFGAYVQARRGGFMAASFPEVFWNIPVQRRPDAPAPLTPMDFEWRPQLFASPELAGFSDWVIARRPGPQILATTDEFPFEPVLVDPPWQVYRRRASNGR